MVPECLRDLQTLLEESLVKYKQPGAVLAVLYDGQVYEVASGTTNVVTNVKATTDSIFMIGSITKVLTATLIMQLVDEGKVDIDTAVRCYLPEFGGAGEGIYDEITVRQLISHTSGMHDLITHTTRGENGVKHYVEEVSKCAPLHPPGQMFSYNNAGFIVAGRIVEVMRGKSWHEAIRDYLLEPLGMDHTATLPERAIRFRAACGHYINPDTGEPALCSEMYWPFGMAPAGTTVNAAARDMIKFAKMHLDCGRASDGTPVLSEASVRHMQQTQIEIPPTESSVAMGMGWWKPSTKVISHSGGGHGVRSYLHVVPDKRVAVALLTNGIPGAMVSADLTTVLLRELAGETHVHISNALMDAPAEPLTLDLSKYAGIYEAAMRTYEIRLSKDKLVSLEKVHVGIPMEQYDLYEKADFVEYTPYAPHYFVAEEQSNQVSHHKTRQLAGPLTFINMEKENGPEYVHQGLRAARRVS